MDFNKMIAELKSGFSLDSDGWDDITNLLDALDLLAHNNVFFKTFDMTKMDSFKGMLEAVRSTMSSHPEFRKSRDEEIKEAGTKDFMFSEIHRLNKSATQAVKDRDDMIVSCKETHKLSGKVFNEEFSKWKVLCR